MPQPISEDRKDRLVSILTDRITRSTGYLETKDSMERERVLMYYNGELPKPQNYGNSKFVSNDVFDSVESMKSQLLETFTGTFTPVTFLPDSAQDVPEAKIATTLTNNAVMVQNDGFEIFEDVIHDGLLGRMGIVKVTWETSEEVNEVSFEDPSDDELAAHFSQNPDADVTDAETDDETGALKSVTLKSTKDTSQVRIESIPPEEFGISGGTKRWDQADLMFHRMYKTPSELVAMGFDQDVVDTLQEGRDWLRNDEAWSRAGDADPNPFGSDWPTDQKSSRKIEVYECYAKLDMKEAEHSERRLWQVFIASNQVLGEPQQVKRFPFFRFTPLPRAHTVWGSSFAGRLVHTQVARTNLKRAVIDHATTTTNPRYTVLRGGLANPKELMENRIGGIVNLNKPDAVQPLMQASLNPFVFQVDTAIQADKEELTGVSQLSQGLNKDAISKQNSADMVEQLVSMSQIRQKVIARRFAETFLKPLYLEVYQLIIENATQAQIVEVAGNYVKVNPSALKVRNRLQVDFSLGYGEKEKEAKKFMMMDAAMSKDPGLATIYTLKQRYAAISKAMDGMGIKDVSTYLLDPATVQPPQPSPMQQAELQKIQSEAAMAQAQAHATMTKAQLEGQRLQIEQAKASHDVKKTGLDALTTRGDQTIEQLKLQLQATEMKLKMALENRKEHHKELMDAAELRLAHQEMEAGKAQAVIAPKD